MNASRATTTPAEPATELTGRSPGHPGEVLDAVVLVTPRSFGLHDPALRAELERSVRHVKYALSPGLQPAEAISLVSDIDGWIAGLDRIDRDVIAAAPQLKVIARYGVGTELVDLDAAAEREITVTNAPAANTDSVAELTLCFILALARQLVPACLAARSGGWAPVPGQAVAGRTLGLIGLGRIGQAVARRALALGLNIIATDPRLGARKPPPGIETGTLEEVLDRADFVSLHVPLQPDTRHLANADFLARMRSGAFLINTSRGDVIDEAALLTALDAGQLAGAALDTLADEPPAPDHPLLRLENVLVTPHVGAHTDVAMTAMGRTALSNCLAVLAGKPPADPVILASPCATR